MKKKDKEFDEVNELLEDEEKQLDENPDTDVADDDETPDDEELDEAIIENLENDRRHAKKNMNGKLEQLLGNKGMPFDDDLDDDVDPGDYFDANDVL